MSELKIYFCGSIRGGRQDAAHYRKIILKLSEYGKVLTEHIGLDNPQKVAHLDDFPPGTSQSEIDRRIHEADMAWLHQADVVIAECTQPSIGVGFELGVAWKLGLPTLALFRPSNIPDGVVGISAMINGCTSDKWIVHNYSQFEELIPAFDDFIAKFKAKA